MITSFPLALEHYGILLCSDAGGSLDQSLKDTLKKFSTEKRFAYWSGYVKSLALHMAETEGSSCTSLTEYQMLISAWRMLLIISTSHADIMHLTETAVRQQLFLEVLSGTKALVPLEFLTVLLSEIPQYSQLVMSVCETLQDEVIVLFDQTRHSLTSGDSADDKDSMETDDACRGKHKDQRDGGAAAVASAGVTQSICLSLLSVYQLSTNGTIQVNLCYLCQACTSLLHSRKMLQHYLQTKNGDSLPSAVTPRVQRTPQTSSKHPSPESEAAEQKALRTVQYGLLKILSKSLAALRHFTPDVCQILLDQSLDLAEYNLLFVLSFTTPAFDSDVAPSFGTLLATVNVALNMLGELDKKKEPFAQAAGLNTQEETKTLKSLLMFTMENCFYLLISQAVRYLRDPAVHPRDKQRMKQELSSELVSIVEQVSCLVLRSSFSFSLM
ncbi:hypothetical protein KIL84_004021 [Mauremys mutica]|uniref:Uncharacterized protein n=1 Tax=Mauremys mutica TaxID=74926 RepID=A0A9D4BCH0_9SAUR|nr:hypothetical protein KIL84_004021 [Mauremys mutica]